MIELFFLYIENNGLNKLIIESDITENKIKRFFIKHKYWNKSKKVVHMYNFNNEKEYISLCFSEDYRLIKVKLKYKPPMLKENTKLMIK
jgi:hypothetical protein